jgi:hypothetical protein
MQPDTSEAAVHVADESEVEKFEIPKLDTTIALWLILFVFGGGLLALYYAGISYFPEVSWQDALTFMALMTIIGGSLLVAYSFLLFVPGAIWSEFLIFDAQLQKVLMMSSRQWEPCVWSVTKQILFPFALFMAFCHFLLYEGGSKGFVPVGAFASLAAVSALLSKDLNEALAVVARREASNQSLAPNVTPDTTALKKQRAFTAACHAPLSIAFIAKAAGYNLLPGVLWTFALLPFASCAALLIERRLSNMRTRRAAENSASVPDHLSLLCRSILAFDSAALLSLMALWFFHRIYKGGASEAQVRVPWELLVLCTIVVILTNLVVSVLFHKRRRQALLTSFLAALLLLGAGEILGTEHEATLPAKIMEKFGFGGMSGTLVLTERGGRLLCQQAIPVTFEERAASEHDGAASHTTKQGEQEEAGLLARAEGMTILSRLGSEYLLRYDYQKRTITLPKKEVVSWSTRLKNSAPDNQDECKLHKFGGIR